MARKSIRILCFGDSLTSGYFSWGLGSHPYSLKLEDKLTGAFPDVDFEIVTDGLPGDVATFERFYNRAKAQFQGDKKFDWTIVLGGTNDLAYNISPPKIYESLQKVWNLAILKKGKVLALTVPECHAKAERLTRRRDELNLSIMTHQQPNYYFFDLESHIPFHSLSEADREKYWDDGLHLAEDGYDWMGEHIANGLIRILRREGTLEPATSSHQRQSSKGSQGEALYSEEAGNPRNLSEGYIVVRKRDLD
ncbi:SGNH hydrolase-type esterase domain-containing protein [Mariannaea sp. PMI_226]|nr:SGNH hydrolase-type esterase domain-containing protein [Mariannaea sp. PMI_226]